MVLLGLASLRVHMRDLIQDFVANQLTDKQRKQIMDDWDELQEKGFIGPCEIRRCVQDLTFSMGRQPAYSWMKELALETFRYVAREKI